MLEDKIEKTGDTLLSGYNKTNASLIANEEETFKQWLADNKDENHSFNADRIDTTATGQAFTELSDSLAREQQDENYDIWRSGSALDDTTVHNRLHREAAHGLMYLDSAEQGAKDLVNLNKLRQEETETLNPDDAFAYAKERGVETLRVDKPIGKNELDYKINRELTRRELTQELATYQNTKDYSSFQKLMVLGAYMSGSVTGAEFAASVGLSVVGGLGIAALLGRVAQTGAKANSIYKGVVAAQTIANMQKAARVQGNAVKAVTNANRVLAEVKKADFATKLAYDTYNFGKIGAVGARASHTTVTIPMMIDGALGEVPSALIKQQASKEMGNDNFTTKDTILTVAGGCLIGGILPHAGTLIKGVASAPGKVIDAVANSIAKKEAAKRTDAILKYYDATLPKIEQGKAKTESYTQEIISTLNKENPVDESYAEEIVQVSGANLTEEEMATKHAVISLALETGGDPSVVNLIPFKTEFYSKILGMYDYIKNNVTATAQEFMEALQSRGIRLGATKKLARHNTVEGLGIDAQMTDLRQMMQTSGWGIGYRISGEKGALGLHYASGMCHEDAQNFLHNIYKAHMLEGTPEGQEALEAAQRHQQTMNTLKQQLDRIVDTYNLIMKENQAAKEAGLSPAYPYSAGGQSIYKLADGRTGSLRDALDELAVLMLPSQKREEYELAQNLMKRIDKETAQAGRVINYRSKKREAIEKAKQTIAEVQEWQKEVSSFLASERVSKADPNRVYYNLNTLIKGSDTHTDYLRKASDEVSKMIDENEALLNSRAAYDETVGDPEEIINRMHTEEVPTAMSNTQITAETMRELAQDGDKSASRLTAVREEFTTWASSEIGMKVMTSIDNIVKVAQRQVDKGQRLAVGFFTTLKQNIVGTDTILNMGQNELKDRFVKAFSTRDKIKTMLGEEAERLMTNKLTPENMAGMLKNSIPQFKAAVTDTLVALLNENLPAKVLSDKHITTLVDRAVERFADAVKSGKTTLKIGDIVAKETAEEAGEVIEKPVVEGSVEASRLWDAVLTPFLDDLRKELTDLQTTNLNMLQNTAKAWEQCLATPGKMTEVILGQITMTWLPTKGAAESIENIASTATDWVLFSKNLDEADKAHNFGGLREWAEDPTNLPEIADNVAMLRAKQAGLLNKTELDQMTTSSKGYQVAKALLDSEARILGLMYNVGSNKTSIMSLCSPQKLRQASMRWLPQNFLNTPMVRNITTFIANTNEKLAPIQRELQRLLPEKDTASARGFANHVLYRLEGLDLQKHFNRDGAVRIDLNMVRDALMGANTPGIGSPLEELIRKHGEVKIHQAIKTIVDGLLGNGEDIGLIKRLESMGNCISADKASFTPKYLDDVEEKLFYKDVASMKQDIKYFGYDDMKSWFDEGIGTGKKAYAVLAKAGAEPYQFYDNLREMARIYASSGLARQELGQDAAEAITKNVSSSAFDRSLDYAINHMCGTYTIPATTGIMVAQAIRRIITTPLLMAAGARSLTDYNYQFQSAVNMGFANATDFGARKRIWSKLARAFGQTDILRSAYLTSTLRANAIHEMMFNVPLGLAPNGAQNTRGFTEATPWQVKLDQYSKDFSSLVVDKFAFVGPLTKFNRSNAALSMMEFVGDWADATWHDISQSEKVLATFERFGFTGYEWDNIFSKRAMSDLTSYVNRFGTTEMPHMGDGKLFFPDLLEDITDDELAAHMRAQKMPVNEVSIARYRQRLMDKASAIINANADEMTSIPTMRTQGVSQVHHDPNTWIGFGVNTLTQFQSFGIGLNYYQHARKLAVHMDRNDPLYNRFLMNVSYNKSMATDFMAFWIESALVAGVLNELIDFVRGNQQSIVGPDGEVNPDVVTKKVTRALFDPTGVLGILLDGAFTSLEKGRGHGGGMALPVAPGVSTLLRDTARVKDALTKESVEGQRGKAVAAAIGQNIIDRTGVLNSLPLKPWAAMLITDKLEEAQKGNQWWSYQDSRLDQGYHQSYAKTLTDYFKDAFTD